MNQWAIGSGLVCAAMLILGFQVVAPINAGVAGICELLAVASGVVFVGLLDGE